jgi:predicted glycosyltransferase
MNILIDIAHPGHVHLTRNTYFRLKKLGHQVYVTVKDIPVAKALLDEFKIPYISLGNKRDNLIGKALLQLKYNYKLLRLIKRNNITIGFGSSMTLAQVSKFSKMKSIILDDDDDDVEPLFVKYAHPFADVILSPKGTKRKSKKTIYYDGFHELSYLHPNTFHPDISILQEIGVLENEPYFVLRFNAFKAHHDLGVQGLSIENKRKLVEFLASKGKVFITTEREIDKEFIQYQLRLSPEKIHSLLYYATMFVGDSQTMTSEAAVLGVPAVKCNSFAGKLSIPNELESKYQLCFSFLPENSDDFFMKINELLQTPNLKEIFRQRKDIMLADKIDVTKFYVWFIENYPESVTIMRENPEYQYKFK